MRRSSSTSCALMFSPPRMITSEVRSVIVRYPSSSMTPLPGSQRFRRRHRSWKLLDLVSGVADVTTAELSTLVEDRLASYKRIGDIIVVAEIPRLPAGKVLRRQLESSYEAGSQK